MSLLTKSGKIVLLRVNEVGDSFGPPPNNMIAEVIVQLDSHTQGAASGFQLRADDNQPVREGMLDLLRDAFNHGWKVGFDHVVDDGKTMGTIVRVWITREPGVPAVNAVGGPAVFEAITMPNVR